MKVEVRAVGLKSMRERKGLTQRKLAHDLGISQNYVPAIEAGVDAPGQSSRSSLVKYFGVRFDELFEVVLVDLERGREGPAAQALAVWRVALNRVTQPQHHRTG